MDLSRFFLYFFTIFCNLAIVPLYIMGGVDALFMGISASFATMTMIWIADIINNYY